MTTFELSLESESQTLFITDQTINKFPN